MVSRSGTVWAPFLLATLLAVPGSLPLSLGEPEPNDTFAQAILVDKDNAGFIGSLSQTDNADMYRILLNRTSTTVESVQADLTKTSTGGQVRLYLYDADGYRLAWNATVTGAPISSSACAPYTGQVFIVVLLWVGSATADYELNITKSNLTPGTGILDGNNRPSEAVPVQDGFKLTKGLDSFFNAGDFYSVQLGTGPAWRDILILTHGDPRAAHA